MKEVKSETFGERVFRLRTALGLSQSQLARKIGASHGSIQNYEANSLPKGEYAIKLAGVFNCSIDWLLTGKNTVPIYKDTNLEPGHGSEKSENAAQSATTHHHQKNDTPSSQPPITELITKTIEIMESETVFSSALSANIQAFHEATRAEQKLTELQANTEKRFKKMDRRIAALETENNKLKEQIKNTPGDSSRLAANEG